MQNLSTKPTRLPEELGMYVDELRKRCSSIAEVWLLDPQPNARTSRCASWQFMVFGNKDTLRALRKDATLHRRDVQFIVVTDGDRFESAWGNPRAGRLSEIAWQPLSLHSATYLAAESAEKTAVRVR